PFTFFRSRVIVLGGKGRGSSPNFKLTSILFFTSSAMLILSAISRRFSGRSVMSSSQYQNGRKNDTGYWIVAIVFLITGFPAPIGFLMIVLKLLGGNKRKRGRHPYYMQQDASYAAPMGARTTAAAAEEDAAAAPKKKKQSKRKK